MKTIFLNKRLEKAPGSVATIGVFDGVHLGHQLVIGKVLEQARQRGLVSTVITFDRSPREVLDPSFRPQLLTTLEEKSDIIASLGVDQLVVLPFTREMASLSAWDFMQQVLSDQLHVKVLFTGYDNRFGHDRTEGFDDYVHYGVKLGMQVLRGDVELMDGELMDGGSLAVSSSEIRRLLADEGRVELMPRYLTRRYVLKGRVMPGEHIGHKIGYPTANLEPDGTGKLIPAAGVYAVWAMLEGEQSPRAAMMNIHHQTLEVNILGFDGDLYGQMVQVTFVERLRDELKFDSPEALAAQLEQDRDRVNEILGL